MAASLDLANAAHRSARLDDNRRCRVRKRTASRLAHTGENALRRDWDAQGSRHPGNMGLVRDAKTRVLRTEGGVPRIACQAGIRVRRLVSAIGSITSGFRRWVPSTTGRVKGAGAASASGGRMSCAA